MRNIGIDEALNRIAERTSENAEDLRKSRLQRRTEFTDLYGVPFYAESVEDNGRHRARFYISVSPDLVYFMRFQFKLYISTLDESGDGDFRISMHGVDITDELIEQEDGDWITGEGLFPTSGITDEEDYYDVLDVATLLYNGDSEDKDNADILLKPGFKRMEITANSAFTVTMYLYCKYSVSGK